MKPYLLQFAFDFVGFAIIFNNFAFLPDLRINKTQRTLFFKLGIT